MKKLVCLTATALLALAILSGATLDHSMTDSPSVVSRCAQYLFWFILC